MTSCFVFVWKIITRIMKNTMIGQEENISVKVLRNILTETFLKETYEYDLQKCKTNRCVIILNAIVFLISKQY